MFLMTAIAAKGITSSTGATDINPFVNVVEFFHAHVLPELQSGIESRPLLKASSLKFTAIFRTQLAMQLSLNILSSATNLLKSENEVVHSYSANLIEKLFGMKDLFTKENTNQFLGTLLAELFAVLERDGIHENDYVIRAILRISKVMQEAMVAHVQMCISKLKVIVQTVCQNPKKPIFNHYMFECIASLIKSIVKVQPDTASSFEGILFDSFQHILDQDIADFVPYVFQIMTLLLDLRPTPIPQLYLGLLPSFLCESLYTRPGNVPPLTALLRSFLSRASNQVIAANQLQPLLGVFQFLVSKKAHDHDGLALLIAVFDFVDLQHYRPLLPTIFGILLTRMSKSTTIKFERNFCLALLSLAAKHGGPLLIETLDAVQAGLSTTILQVVVVRRVSQLSGDDKRVASVGCTRLLCETPALLASPANLDVWSSLLFELVKMLEAPISVTKDENVDDAEMSAAEQTAVSGQPGQTYSKLHFASLKRGDSYAVLPDNRDFLVQSLSKASMANPGKLVQAIAARGNNDLNTWLQSHLARFGLALN